MKRALACPWLTPLYAAGQALLNLLLGTSLEPVERLRWPVISIGNLSTGGAGKTPLTIALAKALSARGTAKSTSSPAATAAKTVSPPASSLRAAPTTTATNHC
jgi:tetraacyldisaccharide-1-P 4'-kinase